MAYLVQTEPCPGAREHRIKQNNIAKAIMAELNHRGKYRNLEQFSLAKIGPRNQLTWAMEHVMEAPATRCTECGAAMKPAQVLCSRCHRPRWNTLKKVSACLLAVAVLAILIRFAVMYGDRTLNLWFG